MAKALKTFKAELLAKKGVRETYEKLVKFWSASSKGTKIFRWTVYSIILAVLFVLGNQVQQFIYVQF